MPTDVVLIITFMSFAELCLAMTMTNTQVYDTCFCNAINLFVKLTCKV